MKNFLTILMLCGATGAFAQNTPRYAASTRTWTFGEQTWSDAIHVPECNKGNFEDSYTAPQCRSYTNGANTWYYYNWAYVDANAASMCPAPWRVPARKDFTKLTSLTDPLTLTAAWGCGDGCASSPYPSTASEAYYWSATVFSHFTRSVYALYYYSENMLVDYAYKCYGFQVRCVK